MTVYEATQENLGAGVSIRLDRFLANAAGCSRAAARRLIDDGQVRLGGRPAGKSDLVEEGDYVEILSGDLPTDDELRPVPERELVLDVLYEDGDLVAVVKPAGIASHPLRPGETGTVANALCGRYPECAFASADPREGGLAHRLDRGTSGVLLAARTRPIWELLREAFRRGKTEKRYLALGWGRSARASASTCRSPTHPRPGKILAVPDEHRARELGAKNARTDVTLVERLGGLSLVDCRTRTRRMHQIRVHLASVGAPIYGDDSTAGCPMTT